MKSINEVFRDIVSSTSAIYGKNISFMFGDWDYVSGILTEWAESPKMSKLRFPLIVLYSPYEEHHTSKTRTSDFDLDIMVDTLKEYTNEEREEVSYKGILRPIYEAFIESIGKSPDIIHNYNDEFPLIYIEDFRYGRKGIEDNNKIFKDFIDVTKIRNLKLTIKNIKCYGDRI